VSRKVNGPVNNGASASLHSVSIRESCCSQAPCRGVKCAHLCQVRGVTGTRPDVRGFSQNKSFAVGLTQDLEDREGFNVTGETGTRVSTGHC